MELHPRTIRTIRNRSRWPRLDHTAPTVPVQRCEAATIHGPRAVVQTPQAVNDWWEKFIGSLEHVGTETLEDPGSI